MELVDIISKLPYSKPFLFVDQIIRIDEHGVEGEYRFDENLDFYKGHFNSMPITPGVILTEVMAQIGLVCLGIYLSKENLKSDGLMMLTSCNVEFFKAVLPNEKVRVISKKVYFRFGKLKCEVSMQNQLGEAVCSGTISGMLS